MKLKLNSPTPLETFSPPLHPSHPHPLTIHILQSPLVGLVPKALLHVAIVCGLELDLGEQVRHNSVEEFQIVHQELWHVGIANGTQYNQFLSGSVVDA